MTFLLDKSTESFTPPFYRPLRSPFYYYTDLSPSDFLFNLPLFLFRTIFDVDIDSFEEKPWKYPGVDVSEFFNFGLNDNTWKDYCKQLVIFLLIFFSSRNLV